MTSDKPSRLRIHPDLSLLVAPFSERARRDLEYKLSRQGCSAPIRVWGDIVLVDQEAYQYCRSRSIPINTTALSINSQEEAIIWICKNQYQRQDLTDEMRRYIIGKRFHSERALGAHEAATARQAARENARENGIPSVFLPPASSYETSVTKTSERLGIEYHISFQTVRKYGIYAGIIDQIHSLEPALAKKILNGDIHISHESMVEISNMNSADIVRMAKYFLSSGERRPTYGKFKAILDQSKVKPPQPAPPPGSIKEMPEYDPDAEVASLALTVPSWIGSIHRTQKNSDFSKISEEARGRLIYALDNLVFHVEGMLSTLKEDIYG